MTFKQKIKQHHLVLLQDKIDVYQDMILGLYNDAQNDAKGSAGDKHETALSMMHLEQEKLTNKLKESIDKQAILLKLNSEQFSSKVILGSVVVTNHITFYISIALPKIIIDNRAVFAISPQSPLGIQMMHKTVHAEFLVNDVTYKILEIL